MQKTPVVCLSTKGTKLFYVQAERSYGAFPKSLDSKCAVRCIMGSVGTHFQPEALKFLRGLARHNDREWFEARREVYKKQIKAPMLALIEEVNGEMIQFAPDHVRTPAKTMMRIYRDTRFSSDKRPYKKHVAAWFGRKGSVRTTGAGFYLHVSASEVHFGAGVFVPLPDQLLAVRQWMAENHTTFASVLKRVTKARKGEQLLQVSDSNPLARMPKGFCRRPPGWRTAARSPVGSRLQRPFFRCPRRGFQRSAGEESEDFGACGFCFG